MAKKLELPEKIKVGGGLYTIYLIEKFEDDEPREYLGYHAIPESEIWVLYNNDIAESTALSSFLHEIIHAIDYVYCNCILEESDVIKLTDVIYQLLADNTLYLTSRRFPPKIRIQGSNYKVSTNHEFTTLGKNYNIAFSPLSKTIKVAYNPTISIYCLKMGLLGCILDNIFSESGTFEHENRNIIPLSNGLYQVLVDNNLEKLFRKWS